MNKRKKSFKSTALKILKEIKFKILNLSIARGLTFIGVIVGLISLFLDWIIDSGRELSWNSFHSISGNNGYIFIPMFIVMILLIFGNNYKEKMKLHSNIDFKNHSFSLFVGFFMILSSISVISFSVGLETFSQEVVYGNGVILFIVSAIFIIIGGYMSKKEFYKNNSEIILEKLNQERKKEKEKNNMSLPF